VSGALAVVLGLHLTHLASSDARGSPHQMSHSVCLCAGSSEVLVRCGVRVELQRQMTLREADRQARCRAKLWDWVVH